MGVHGIVQQDDPMVCRLFFQRTDSQQQSEVTNVVGAVLPNIENDTLTWNNDARYCVTPGVLWGEARLTSVTVRMSDRTESLQQTQRGAQCIRRVVQRDQILSRLIGAR